MTFSFGHVLTVSKYRFFAVKSFSKLQKGNIAIRCFKNQDINDFNGFRKQFVINILLLRKDTGSAIEHVYNVYYLDVHNM